ncbi:MAG: hypothetical protein EPO27_09085 [Betaproteobacteria bacterium]|nr:MAG: hypothetical protein EPO27_09085 [Betaproteobacteria bacterium]
MIARQPANWLLHATPARGLAQHLPPPTPTIPLVCFTSALLLSLQALPTNAETAYSVKTAGAPPQELIIALTLPSNEGQVRKLAVRGTAWGLESQVHSLRCGKTPLRQDAAGSWVAPGSCHMVTWHVSAKRVRDGAVDVSKQASLLFENPRWFLLSEPTSLLRLVGDSRQSTLTVSAGSLQSIDLGATPAGKGRWRVPSTNNAPEFYVIGNIKPRTRSIGPFQVRYVADNPGRVDRLGLEAIHERALQYLVRVLPPPAALPIDERMLLVVWIGTDDRHGRAGGSAGSRSFVANYVFGRAETEALNAARTLTILAHEQFHQLSDLLRGSLQPFPVWLGESLAQYYGLKALAQASSGPAATSVRANFIDPTRPVNFGLVELNRRHAAKDPSAYRLFYEQGATFWAALDTAVLARSGGTRSLDSLIPELLRSNPTEDGKLPAEFIDKLRLEIGSQTDELLSKYVGD